MLPQIWAGLAIGLAIAGLLYATVGNVKRGVTLIFMGFGLGILGVIFGVLGLPHS
jgi:hypothetical protein